MYAAALKTPKIVEIIIYFYQIAQIASLHTDQAPIEIFSEYLDYSNIFLANPITNLLEYNGMNNYAIKLVKDK